MLQCVYKMYIGLKRCGKSCRLIWANYLRPDIKRGEFTTEEDDTIIKLHALKGNKYEYFLCLLLFFFYEYFLCLLLYMY